MATNTMVKKEQSAPYADMATSFIKPAGVKVLTTENTIESYPACSMRELHNLADMFGWVILPLNLVSFDSIIKAYSSESVYYAWELYQAFNRFKKSASGNMRFYIIAPFSFLDTYSLMTNYSGLDDIIENAYFPQSLKEIQNSIRVLKPILIQAGSIINGMAKIIEDNRRRQQIEEDKKKDPCIFAIDTKHDICNPKAIARIGLCWGPELPDFIVGDLPRNNGAFQSVTYPWSKDWFEKVTPTDLDKNREVRDKIYAVENAYETLDDEWRIAYNWYYYKSSKQPDEEKIIAAVKVLEEKFPIWGYGNSDFKKIKEAIDKYFYYHGHWGCPGIGDSNAYGGHVCTDRSGCAYKDKIRACSYKSTLVKNLNYMLMDFYHPRIQYYYVEQFRELYKSGNFIDFLNFIPLIKEKEAGVLHTSIISLTKMRPSPTFPEFWTFYELVTK